MMKPPFFQCKVNFILILSSGCKRNLFGFVSPLGSVFDIHPHLYLEPYIRCSRKHILLATKTEISQTFNCKKTSSIKDVFYPQSMYKMTKFLWCNMWQTTFIIHQHRDECTIDISQVFICFSYIAYSMIYKQLMLHGLARDLIDLSTRPTKRYT